MCTFRERRISETMLLTHVGVRWTQCLGIFVPIVVPLGWNPRGAQQRTWGHTTLPRNPPPWCPGSLIWTIKQKTQGVAVAEWSEHFLGKVLLAELEQCLQGIFFPIYPCKITNGFLWNRKTHMTQNGCVVSALFFQVENITRAPSPPSPFHSSMSLLLQFSHRLSDALLSSTTTFWWNSHAQTPLPPR